MKAMRFSVLVMAVMTAMCFTACSNNDDDSNDQKSSIVTPKFKGDKIVGVYKPDPALALSNGYKLQSIEFTESGRAYVTIENTLGKRTTFNASFTFEDDGYNLAGDRISGKIKDLTTKGTQSIEFKVTLSIKTEGGDIMTETTSEAAITAMKTVGELVGDVDIISSWRVRGIEINVKGDYDFFREFSDGNLKNILDYAKSEGVEFSEKEEKELSKVIQYVSVSTQHITIDYTDGTSDMADWDWAGSVYDKLQFELLEHGMGNKFIVNDPAVKIEFNKPKAYLNVVFKAKITGDKNYDASLTLRLAQMPEAPVVMN